jgi:hypothetical protein
MKHAIRVLMFVLTCTGQAFAWDNICSVAGPLVNATSVQVDAFADKNMQRSFEGTGKTWDVKSGGAASKVTVVVRCGNNVWVEIPTSSPRATINLQKGESINFSGKLYSVRQKRYPSSGAVYLMVGFEDNASVW